MSPMRSEVSYVSSLVSPQQHSECATRIQSVCPKRCQNMGPPHAPLPTRLQAAVPLSRPHLDRVDEGLHGVTGAQKIISQLNAQRSAVTKLILNHNPLGDSGVTQLFNYLCSTPGSRHRIALSEINLNCTEVGCKGLQAISEYIRGNEALRTLWLASNVLLPDPTAFSSLASAINDSRLRFLSLTGNNQLGDAFVEHFFPTLRSCHLHELHINAVGLTARSAPAIGAWISGRPQRSRDASGACHLQVLKSSGNSLGVSGVWEIVRAIERGNWSITKVEVYNQLVPCPNLPDIETVDTMKDAEHALHRVLMRNSYWKRQTEKEALLLLMYSRPLLMRPKSSPMTASLSRSTSPPLRTATSLFPFYALPIELKLHILGLLAPSLSLAQHMRVYNYASDPSTLPHLLPPLRYNSGEGCLADPPSSASSNGQRRADGKRKGASNSPLSRREEARTKFLEAVGCCAYEPQWEGQD